MTGRQKENLLWWAALVFMVLVVGAFVADVVLGGSDECLVVVVHDGAGNLLAESQACR